MCMPDENDEVIEVLEDTEPERTVEQLADYIAEEIVIDE